MPDRVHHTRRAFLAASAGAAFAADKPATISITFDLEMSRNFPTWETTHWDYEKGNLDAASKKYAVEAARRVKEAGGTMHFFCVGRVLEQEDVGWLQEIARMGHAVGNHTYDHVNVLARKPEDVQFRFKRAPWLLRGEPADKAIANNVALCTEAMKTRLGFAPIGFRTPGGFENGLAGRADVQRLLMNQGFRWVSSQYTRHPIEGDPRTYLPDALRKSQPFRYPETGLLEIPMAPVSDINAFRNGRWPLARFIDATKAAVEWTIANGAVFDMLAHPSCLGVVDPGFETITAILRMVADARSKAKLSDLRVVAG